MSLLKNCPPIYSLVKYCRYALTWRAQKWQQFHPWERQGHNQTCCSTVCYSVPLANYLQITQCAPQSSILANDHISPAWHKPCGEWVYRWYPVVVSQPNFLFAKKPHVCPQKSWWISGYMLEFLLVKIHLFASYKFQVTAASFNSCWKSAFVCNLSHQWLSRW